jgi:hypothetical protein
MKKNSDAHKKLTANRTILSLPANQKFPYDLRSMTAEAFRMKHTTPDSCQALFFAAIKNCLTF